MLRPYLKIWEWELIFRRAVKAIYSPDVRSPWVSISFSVIMLSICIGLVAFINRQWLKTIMNLITEMRGSLRIIQKARFSFLEHSEEGTQKLIRVIDIFDITYFELNLIY